MLRDDDHMPRTTSLTYIAVDVELEIGVVGPYDSIDAIGKVLPEKPEAQKHNTEIPALSYEAG